MFYLIRKIKKKAFYKGNLKKYLFYAVGELILIIIGIWLALWVDRWYGQLNENKVFHHYCEGLIEDLRSDSVEMRHLLKQGNVKKAELKRIKTLIDDPNVDLDSVIQISKNGVDLKMLWKYAYNTGTIYALLNSGDIDLFDPYGKKENFRF